jgi:hypothetical protein
MESVSLILLFGDSLDNDNLNKSMEGLLLNTIIFKRIKLIRKITKLPNTPNKALQGVLVFFLTGASDWPQEVAKPSSCSSEL